jgi:hypothetical protein
VGEGLLGGCLQSTQLAQNEGIMGALRITLAESQALADTDIEWRGQGRTALPSELPTENPEEWT